jgi:hypothetical protein
MWVEHMAAGRGWIALALVVFATWRPVRVLAGAYLFGGMTILQLHAQALGLAVPSQLLSALPYLATIGVLVVISRDVQTIRVNAPVSLGKPFIRGLRGNSWQPAVGEVGRGVDSSRSPRVDREGQGRGSKTSWQRAANGQRA